MSLTILSLAAGAIIVVAQYVGTTFTQDELQAWFATTGKILSALALLGTQAAAWYGRVRRGDIDWLGRKK